MYAPGTVTVRRMPLNCPIEVPRKNVVTANRAFIQHSKRRAYRHSHGHRDLPSGEMRFSAREYLLKDYSRSNWAPVRADLTA
jgi:hypothetical protein